ncbi:MAG: Fic family protein [Proteobacteria bacterium]|nr:Fic family protein [Pseudomonadota bacterium]
MDQAEYEALVRVQEEYLHRVTKRTQFNEKRLREMHLDWLGEIYEWAGTYRAVELAKGDFRWPPAYLVHGHMETLESEFLRKHTPCGRGPLDDVAMAIAKVHAEFLLIHPFREGNGRLARWLASLMALQADYPMPEYRFSGRGSVKERERYLEAVRRGYQKDYEALALFFVEAIDRRRT